MNEENKKIERYAVLRHGDTTLFCTTWTTPVTQQGLPLAFLTIPFAIDENSKSVLHNIQVQNYIMWIVGGDGCDKEICKRLTILHGEFEKNQVKATKEQEDRMRAANLRQALTTPLQEKESKILSTDFKKNRE